MMMGALAALLPDRVMACSQGTSAILTLGGVDPRSQQRYVSYETIKGGFGARSVKDGINGVASGISNTMNTPIELLEMSFPVRVERYELTPDSGGPGRWRGGLGVERVWRVLGHATVASVCFERTKSAPFGLHGGRAGAAGRVVVIDPYGAEAEVNSKGSFTVPAGGAVWFRAPGSGGYGPPAERDRARIHDDVVNGYLTTASAARDYGAHGDSALDCPWCRAGNQA
jgi:N-methylhydantoinase B